MEKTSKHISVFLEEAVELLDVRRNGIYLDCTFGGGGHSRLILERSTPDGHVVALDRDAHVQPFADACTADYPGRFVFHHLSYARLDELDQEFDGVLFDLGFSTDQLEGSGRGFSFTKNEPLDLRFDDRGGQTAAQLLSQATPDRLIRIFQTYAEDRYAKSLVRKIIETRRAQPIRTTTDFVQLVGTKQPTVLAPLFQALRIEVNDELSTLERGLALANASLKIGGRLVVISFHSLEDRIVKEFMRSHMDVVTKKPIAPSPEAIQANPRVRSAKLRSAAKLNNKE
jgi:16S rRNA (cytosine1402-N4)-methyltransferase